jgi:hypothetical protein
LKEDRHIKRQVEKRVAWKRRRLERNEFVKKPETKGTRIRNIKVATQNEILAARAVG